MQHIDALGLREHQGRQVSNIVRVKSPSSPLPLSSLPSLPLRNRPP